MTKIRTNIALKFSLRTVIDMESCYRIYLIGCYSVNTETAEASQLCQTEQTAIVHLGAL